MKETMLEAILRDIDDPDEREALRETWNQLEVLETAEPSHGLDRDFARKIELAQDAAPRSVFRGGRLLPFAAVLIVGIAIGVLAGRWPFAPREDRPGIGAPRADVVRLSRVVSLAFAPRSLAPRRLEAVEALATMSGDPEARRVLSDVVSTDTSIDVRLCAVDAIGSYVTDEQIARRLIGTAQDAESTLLRIRLIELFVDHQVDAALPAIESLARDPRTDALVRETAQWASARLTKRRPS